ncbi:MAG: glycine dehydrogenase subunit 2, partial [Anaerolineales bacterium]
IRTGPRNSGRWCGESEPGVHSEEIGYRAADFGTHYWTSHHPYIVPEPMTLEPTESYSKTDLDEYALIIQNIAEEAYRDPDFIHQAPYNSTIHRIHPHSFDDPEAWAVTWRAYQRKVRQAKLDG